MEIQDELKASTNLRALQEHIHTMWEHGPENRSENSSCAVQSKPDQKKASASQASEQRSGKNSPERRQQRCKAKTLEKHFVSIHKQQHPPPGAKPPPTPPPPPPTQNDPQKHQPTTSAKFCYEFLNNAMELRARGKAFSTRLSGEMCEVTTDVRNAQNDQNYFGLLGLIHNFLKTTLYDMYAIETVLN